MHTSTHREPALHVLNIYRYLPTYIKYDKILYYTTYTRASLLYIILLSSSSYTYQFLFRNASFGEFFDFWFFFFYRHRVIICYYYYYLRIRRTAVRRRWAWPELRDWSGREIAADRRRGGEGARTAAAAPGERSARIRITILLLL